MRKTSLIFIMVIIAALLVTFSGCEGVGNTGGDSAEEDTKPPAEVTDLSAIAGDSESELSWNNPSDNDFDHCEIWYGIEGKADTEFTGTVDATATTITGLTNNTKYSFTVKTVDTTGNISSGTTVTATPLPAPVIVSSTPANGATGVSPQLLTVEITFDKEMQSGYSITRNKKIDDTISWSDTKTFQITINEPLLSSTEFVYTLNPDGHSSGFRSEDGIALARNTEVSFVTADDDTEPEISSSTPQNGATGVSRDISEILITFDDAMQHAWSFSWGDLENFVQDPTGQGAADWVSSNTIRINIDSQLDANTAYTITLNPSGHSNNFRNGTDVILPENTEFSFETGS
jgi:hypothetical protein